MRQINSRRTSIILCGFLSWLMIGVPASANTISLSDVTDTLIAADGVLPSGTVTTKNGSGFNYYYDDAGRFGLYGQQKNFDT